MLLDIILFNLLWRRFMYKNIIFDLGNVLLDFNPRDYLKNKISDDKLEDVFKAVFTSEEWIMLDRGTITEKEAINNIISRNSTYIKEINLAFESWYDILKPIEESINILMSLKKNGYKIYYLSNFHQLAFAEVTKKNSFFELFDGGVVSYEEKLIKPEEDIYKLVLDRYKLNPSETIFIDDTKVNVDAANSIGIKGILFKDSEKLREELNSLEVKI
jgi:HAD hydrolase, family IA, variant 3